VIIKVATIKDVCTQINGVTYGKDDVSDTCKANYSPILRASNISNDGTNNYDNLIYVKSNLVSDSKHIKEGDILIASSTGSKKVIGKATQFQSDFNGSFGAFCKVLRPNENINKKYLGFFFQRPEYRKYISTVVNGANINNIRSSHLNDIEIPLPPLETQKQIAQVLETADQLRKDCQQVEQELNALAQSMFLDMFGDPVINPKGWKEQNFSGLIHGFKYGSSVKSGDQGTPILRIPNVTGGKISLSDLKHVLLSKNELEKNTLINGDILFVRTNGNRAYIGRSAVFDLKGIFVYASYLIRARVNEKLVTPYFITALLRTNSGREMLMKQAKTTAGQFNINTQGLGNLKIYIPPLSLQKRFESIFLLIEKQKDENRGKLKQFDDLFNALLQKAFKGELNLKSTEHA